MTKSKNRPFHPHVLYIEHSNVKQGSFRSLSSRTLSRSTSLAILCIAGTLTSQSARSQESNRAEAPTSAPTPQGIIETESAVASTDASIAPAAVPGNPEGETLASSGGTAAANIAATREGHVEFGAERARLSNGFEDWSGFYTRGVWQANANNVLNFEIARQDRFGEQGTFFSLGDTYTFNEDLYGSLTLGTSTGASFLPRFRADAFINRKLLPKKNLVATLGFGLYEAREIYKDRSLYVGATYYFPTPWIVEGGVRFNRSNPGSVDSRSQFIAITNGRDKQRYITARYEWGNEAYQIVGPGAALSDFDSDVFSLTLRQWLGEKQGVNVVAERYKNPFYSRNGLSAGYFREF